MTIKIQGTNTTAAPGITGGDTDTGVQFGTNEVKIVTGGTDRATVDSTGNSLFNGEGKFVAAAGAAGGFRHVFNNAGYWLQNDSGASTFAIQPSDGAITTNAKFHGHIQVDSSGTYTDPNFEVNATTGSGTFKGSLRIGGSAAANEMDEYEEGSWVVTCANSVTLHSNCNTATYTKIGRKITVTGQIRVNNNNSNANLHITNLPFAAAGWTTNTNDGCAVGSVRLYQAGITGACKTLICITDNGDDNLYFTEVRDNQDDLPCQATTNGFYAFNITYFTS